MQEPIEDSSCAEDDEIVVKPTKTPKVIKKAIEQGAHQKRKIVDEESSEETDKKKKKKRTSATEDEEFDEDEMETEDQVLEKTRFDEDDPTISGQELLIEVFGEEFCNALPTNEKELVINYNYDMTKYGEPPEEYKREYQEWLQHYNKVSNMNGPCGIAGLKDMPINLEVLKYKIEVLEWMWKYEGINKRDENQKRRRMQLNLGFPMTGKLEHTEIERYGNRNTIYILQRIEFCFKIWCTRHEGCKRETISNVIQRLLALQDIMISAKRAIYNMVRVDNIIDLRPGCPRPESSLDVMAFFPGSGADRDNAFQYTLHAAYEMLQQTGKRKYGRSVYKERLTKHGHATNAWEMEKTIEEWVSTMIDQPQHYSGIWDKLTIKPGIPKQITTFLETMSEQHWFPTVEFSRDMWTYENGTWLGEDMKFIPFNSETETVPLFVGKDKSILASCKYIPREFRFIQIDITKKDLTLEQIVSHEKLATPFFDGILKKQGHSSENIGWICALLGRMFYVINKHDRWEVSLYLLGLAATGKTTILKILAEFFDKNAIGFMASTVENQWALMDKWNKLIIICGEVGERFNWDQNQFQQCNSGEAVPVQLKGRPPIVVNPWEAAIILVGNLLTKSWSNNLGNLSRRLVFVLMQNLLSHDETRGNLFDDIAEQEIDLLHQKWTYCYRFLAYKHGKANFWKVAPPKLKSDNTDVFISSSVVESFIKSQKVCIAANKMVSFTVFMDRLKFYAAYEKGKKGYVFDKNKDENALKSHGICLVSGSSDPIWKNFPLLNKGPGQHVLGMDFVSYYETALGLFFEKALSSRSLVIKKGAITKFSDFKEKFYTYCKEQNFEEGFQFGLVSDSLPKPNTIPANSLTLPPYLISGLDQHKILQGKLATLKTEEDWKVRLNVNGGQRTFVLKPEELLEQGIEHKSKDEDFILGMELYYPEDIQMESFLRGCDVDMSTPSNLMPLGDFFAFYETFIAKEFNEHAKYLDPNQLRQVLTRIVPKIGRFTVTVGLAIHSPIDDQIKYDFRPLDYSTHGVSQEDIYVKDNQGYIFGMNISVEEKGTRKGWVQEPEDDFISDEE